MNKKMREILSQIEKKRDESKALSNKGETSKALALLDECELLEKEFKEEEVKFKLAKDLNIPSEKDLTKNHNHTVIKEAIYPNEKYKRNHYENNKDLDFGKLVKGMVKGKWEDADKEREYISKNMTSTGSVLIPDVLSDQIIDMARSKAAIFGNVPVVPMEHNNLTVAVQTGDATASFVKEGDAIPDSDIKFGSVSLKGKTLAIYVPVQEQLLDSAPNITQQLINSVTQALALGLDKAMLYGKGVTEDSEEIKGICNIPEINNIEDTVDSINYDFVVKGTAPIRKANITPTNIVYNTSFADELSLLKDADGNYINRPTFCDNYVFNESNNIKDNQVLCYDMNSLLLGLHTDMKMEWGYINDQFKRIQKGLRIYIRADFVPVRPKGVSLVTINKQD